MISEELESKLKSLTETVKKLAARQTVVEDIEAINKLQSAYAYYLEHWQEEEILGLWSHSPDVTLEMNDGGQYKGWEGVKNTFRFSDHYTAHTEKKKAPPEYLHIMMPNAGIVHLVPDGKTAKGRWHGFFIGALPRGGKLRALIGCGIWENEFVKEDGIWKFRKLFWNDIFSSPLDEGWVKTPWIPNPPAKHQYMADVPPSPGYHFSPYPSGNIFPYHYKNPVAGK